MKTLSVYLLACFLFIAGTSIAQPNFNDPKLAREYYMNKEFDKAVILYESLYKSQPSQSNLTFYLNCLWALDKYDEAEKVLKQAYRKNKNDLSLLVKLGNNYQKQGYTEQAQLKFDEAINKLKPKTSSIYQVANAFRSYRLWEYAGQTYLKGRELLNNPDLFHNELASVYMMQRKYENMISEWLGWIRQKPQNIQFVKNQLLNLLRVDVEDNMYDMVRSSLIRSIQANPSETTYTELLIWLYIQKKEFNKAFIQAKAIDKKFNLGGSDLIKLARLAERNEDLNTASKIYQYIVDLGKKGRYYYPARKAGLNLQYKILQQQNNLNRSTLQALEKEYQKALDEFGRNAQSADLINDLAHIQAFYLDQQDKAVENLEYILSLKNVDHEIWYNAKLELADIKLLQNKVWEAALLYGQVEADNESNPVGHEAKLRKAKLAYYTGDFLWAQAQLDILKASTSKLIANDAFQLADFISTNSALDTSDYALKQFARADLYRYRQLDSLAILTYDSVLTSFPGHSLSDDALYYKAKIRIHQKRYTEAEPLLREITEHYADGVLGDNALFDLATLTDFQMKNPEAAAELYKQLLTQYPSSIFVPASRERYRAIKGDNEELQVPAETEIHE